MAIKFICGCGKHLRARDEMAARRSFCPNCGAPVGIPSGRPTQRGTTAEPLSPLERKRRPPPPPEDTPQPWAAPGLTVRELTTPEPSAPAPGPPLDPDAVQVVTPRKRVRRRPEESDWLDCLLYPFSGLPVLLGLAVALTVLTAGTVLALPRVIEMRADPWPVVLIALTYLVVPVLLAGYAWGWLESVLAAAANGDIGYRRWPGRNLGLALWSGLRWLACFLAGPVLFVVGMPLYWIYCGEEAVIDWVILGELSLLAVGYWLFVLAAVARDGSLAAVNPLRVLGLIDRLGRRAAVAALLGWLLTLGDGALALTALKNLHDGPVGGVLLLALCWLGGLFFLTFLFRLLGVWLRRLPVEGEQKRPG